MKLTFHDSVDSFWSVIGPILEEQEAANNLMIGLCNSLRTRPSEEPPLLVTVDGPTPTAAVRIRSKNLILTYARPGQLADLAEALAEKREPLQAIVGPPESTQYFARQWTEATDQKVELDYNQRIYQLDRVIQPAPVAGKMRVATESDLDLVSRWVMEFQGEALRNESQNPQAAREAMELRINQGNLFLWEREGTPVAMTAVGGLTARGIRLGAVYTPAPIRRQGLASALVAAVSQEMLDRGRKFCFLYTDLANPTSNGIYQKIGYVPVCDSRMYRIRASSDTR